MRAPRVGERRFFGRVLILVLAVGLVGLPSAGGHPAQAGTLAQQGGYAPSFEVAGAVTRPRTYTLADLQALPAFDVVHQCVNEDQAMERHVYRGVALWSLLADAGLAVPAGRAPASVRSYVVAAGSDGYEAIIALAAIDPAYTQQLALVAYQRDGQPLDQSLGMAQIVLPSDLSCMRDVFWLTRLEVRHIDSPPRSGR